MNQQHTITPDTTHQQGFRIRQITPEDYAEIYELIRTAFLTAKVKDGDEQDFAVRLRNGEGYIPELDLVAEMDGKLIGHIMFTHTFVLQSGGRKHPALLVAPLATLLEYRGYGVGSALMHEGFRIARKLGHHAAFLCGDPDYYSRFGYAPMGNFGIKSKLGIPEPYSLAYELTPGALSEISGILEGF